MPLVASALPPAPLRKGKEHKKQPKTQIMALVSGLDVENNVCDSAQKESQSWNLKQVQAQLCGHMAHGVLGSASPRGSWAGRGKCQSLILDQLCQTA